jgi:hypothetical protein
VEREDGGWQSHHPSNGYIQNVFESFILQLKTFFELFILQLKTNRWNAKWGDYTYKGALFLSSIKRNDIWFVDLD